MDFFIFQNLKVRVKAAFMAVNAAVISVTCLLIHLSRIWCNVFIESNATYS